MILAENAQKTVTKAIATSYRVLEKEIDTAIKEYAARGDSSLTIVASGMNVDSGLVLRNLEKKHNLSFSCEVFNSLMSRYEENGFNVKNTANRSSIISWDQ